MERATFRKHEHLCGQLRIQEVFRTGRGFSDAPFRLVGKFMDLPTKAPAQVAFSVPRKHLRRSRNPILTKPSGTTLSPQSVMTRHTTKSNGASWPAWFRTWDALLPTPANPSL